MTNDSPIAPGGEINPDRFESDDGPAEVVLTLQRDLNKRLDKYLGDRIPWLSRTSLQRLIREDAVRVNDRVPKPSTKLRKGDTVRVILPPAPDSTLPAEEIPLDIMYEDDDLLILNKHDDIIVHPARGNQSGTIINGLAWHFQQQGNGQLSDVGSEHARPGVVHRLDRHTTGVMVVAKNETAHWRIGKQFQDRRTRKRYLALVHGDVSPKNIVLGPAGPVFLDAECAWYGDPAFDLAFCLNHLLLKCIWVPAMTEGYLESYAACAARYLEFVDWEPAEDLERRTAALLPGLMLARIDGASPVEYITDDIDRNRVRRAAGAALRNPPETLADLCCRFREDAEL